MARKVRRPDPDVVAAAAGLLREMTGIAHMPKELRDMSLKDAVSYISKLRGGKPIAYSLTILYAAYGIDRSEQDDRIYTKRTR